MNDQFRIAKGWRLFAYLCAPLLAAVFVYIGLIPFLKNQNHQDLVWILPLVSLFMIAGCIAGIVDAYKSRIIFSEEAIIQKSAFSEKELPYNQVKGYKQDDKYLYIEPLYDAYPKLKITKYTERFSELKAEVANRFTDLDQEQLQAEENEILENEALGPTSEERSDRLQKARQICKVLNIVAMADGFWLMIAPAPYHFCMYVSIAFVLFCFVVLYRFQGIIRVNEKPKSAYPSLAVGFMMPSFGLMIRALIDYTILQYNNLFLMTLACSIILLLLLWYCTGSFKDSSRLVRSLYYIIFFAIFSFGALTQVNALEDHSKEIVYSAQVLDKTISKGKSTTYYLELSPWGPRKNEERVSVPGAFFQKTEIGESVQVHLKNGYLHVPWFYITD